MIATPLSFLWLLILIGLCIRPWYRRVSSKLLIVSGIFFVILGALPVGYNMVVLLERQYARPDLMPKQVDGIIVLGGAFNSTLSEKTGMISANGNINRMIDFADLSRKYPRAKLVFSGGSGSLGKPDRKEADDAEAFMKMVGMNTRRVTFERNSRNTYENVKYSKEIVNSKKGETWLLVTSSFHMPRSVGVFKHFDWPVIPYPSGPKTDGKYKLWPTPFGVPNSFFMLGKATKEIIGAAIYYFSGKSAFLLPLSPLDSANNDGEEGAK